jgi:hypothetical protein
MTTHEDLLVALAVIAGIAVTGFALIAYMIWSTQHHALEVMKAIAGLVYQEAEKTRAAARG